MTSPDASTLAAQAGGDGYDPGPETSANPFLRLHLLLYGRYKWAIGLGLLLAVCAAALVWSRLPPKYEVVGYIRIKPYIPPVLKATDQTGVLPMFETFVSLQVSLLQSQRILDQASLSTDWKALKQTSPRWGSGIPADSLTVDHPRDSELVTVGFTDRDPSIAAVAVKAILQAYQATSGDTDDASDAHRLQVLEDLRTSLTNQKRSLSDQILALANPFGSDDLQSQYQFKLEQQNRLESELQQIALDISIAQAAAGGSSATTGASTQPAATAPAVAATAPATQPKPARLTREDVAKVDSRMFNLLADERTLSSQLEDLRRRWGENNYQVQAARSAWQANEDEIKLLMATHQEQGMTAPTSDGSRLSLPELRLRETYIRALFEKVQAETKALGQEDLKIRKLKEDRDMVSTRLDETTARIDQLNLESTVSNRISVLSYGERPTAPLPNKRVPATAGAGFAGLAAGVGLVALRGRADRRVRCLLHMQQLAPAIRVLGVLPVLPDDLTDPAQVSFAAHCVHQIRILLEAIPTHDKGRVLAITSPSPGDGKTSLALALGLSFAASGSRTLLIDCDMIGGGLTRRLNAIAHRRIGSILQRQGLLTERQVKEALRVAEGAQKKFGEVLVELGYLSAPDVARTLADQVETSVGLLDALDGEPVAACVTPVVMDGLSLLPRGDAAAASTSQISAKALRRLIKEARAQFDLIIIDTGPLLGSLEASVAAREADEVILTVARGAPSPLVIRTVELLGTLAARLGGIVFNRATPSDVAYSNYGSSSHLRSFHSSDTRSRSQSEARGPLGSPPRLGPVAAAVATASNGVSKDLPAISHANGAAQPPSSDVVSAHEQESAVEESTDS